MLLSAAATQPGRSWAGLIALAAAYVIFRVGSYAYTKIKKPSPTRALTGVKRVKVQSSVGVDTDRTDKHEWGAISHEGRKPVQPAATKPALEEPRRSLLDRAKQIWSTGDHELPPAEGEPADDVDVPLDDEAEETDQAETAEEYIARCRDLGVPYVHIVKVVSEHYGLTTDQAKYRIRKVDDARRGPAAA